MQEPKFPTPPALVVVVPDGVAEEAVLVATTRLLPTVTVTVTTDVQGPADVETPRSVFKVADTDNEVEGNTEDEAEGNAEDDAGTDAVEFEELK